MDETTLKLVQALSYIISFLIFMLLPIYLSRKAYGMFRYNRADTLFLSWGIALALHGLIAFFIQPHYYGVIISWITAFAMLAIFSCFFTKLLQPRLYNL